MNKKKILISEQPHQAAGLKPGPTSKETLENWLRECGGDPENKRVRELREELEKILPESFSVTNYDELPKSLRIWLRELNREITFIGSKQTPELRSLPVEVLIEKRQIERARDATGLVVVGLTGFGVLRYLGIAYHDPGTYLVGSLALFTSLIWRMAARAIKG